MSNNNRFTFKILGVVTVEIVKVTPKEVRKTITRVAILLFLAIILLKLPALITAIRWW